MSDERWRRRGQHSGRRGRGGKGRRGGRRGQRREQQAGREFGKGWGRRGKGRLRDNRGGNTQAPSSISDGRRHRCSASKAAVLQKRKVGLSYDLEKTYLSVLTQCCSLSLTTEPNWAKVRPRAVLKMALKHVVDKYRGMLESPQGRESRRAYAYVNDQLKAIRQDLRVQQIFNDALAVNVYEMHGRLAVRHGDLSEFNSCQMQLQQIYESVSSSLPLGSDGGNEEGEEQEEGGGTAVRLDKAKAEDGKSDESSRSRREEVDADNRASILKNRIEFECYRFLYVWPTEDKQGVVSSLSTLSFFQHFHPNVVPSRGIA
eukprot:jgi/Bigna1/84105/fgenesh1_pg.123_\